MDVALPKQSLIHLPRRDDSQSASKRIAEHTFREESDQATVIDFSYASNTASQWTGKL